MNDVELLILCKKNHALHFKFTLKPINPYFRNRMSKLQQIIDYISFIGHSNNSHGIHSPFVFNLYNEVLNVKKEYYFFGPIESLRASYLNNQTQIEMLDLGAGSTLGNASTRKISSIASTSLQSAKYAALLFRLVDYFQPKNMIELGTSLGITTSYLAKAVKNSNIITIEGNPNLSAIAQQGFQKLAINNITCKTGSFDSHFLLTLKELQQVDFILFDGNHRYEATIQYFHDALAYTNQHTVFVFDDIYWSVEMKQAWQTIKEHPQVTVTIDLFEMGLVFFKKGQYKQHFKLRV
jgi:predicted O-methyltransferase YrrM